MSLYRRRGSSHWWIRLSVAGVKTRRSTGTADAEQAHEFERRERDRLWRLHKLGDRGALRWKDATARYLSDSQRSRSRDRQILTDLATDLDVEQVSAIDADAIHELRLNLIATGKSHATVDRYMRTIRAVLRACVRWRVLEAAPAISMYNAAAPEPRWLSPNEFERLLAELPEHMRPAATFAVQTGLRHDSMLSLTWERVDLRAARAWVPGSEMKAGRAQGVFLNKRALAALRELRRGNETPWVFQWKGKRLVNCNTRAFREAVQRAGVAPLRWHDLRHTFAAWAVQGGATLQDVMQLGGWRSYAMVLRYAHLSTDHLAAAAAKVGAFQGTARKRSVRKK